ncbi:MAG TPA: histidine phosphatase family protein [Acidimicrobiales bacterium]|nr:histidine phosphatase family protein [Acidimicrobiales bacterium]
MNLLLIRHALPQRVELAEGRADPALSEEGLRQAARLGEWLKHEEIHGLYASHLLRAQQTAQPIAAAHGLEIVTEPDVAEFDRDASSYIPFEEIDRNSAEFQAIVSGDYTAIGGPKPDEFMGKIVAAMDRIIERHPGQTVAVVCHAGVINAYIAHILELNRVIFFGPGYTSVNRVLANARGMRGVGSLNELAHLRGI